MVSGNTQRQIAPNIYSIVDELDTKSTSPDVSDTLKQQYSELSEHLIALSKAEGGIAGMLALERNLQQDESFRAQVRDLAANNPAALKDIAADVLQKPDSMTALVGQTHARVAGTTTSAPRVSAIAPAAGASPAVQKKFEELSRSPGFDELMEQVDANPHVQDMVTQLLGGEGTDGANAEGALDGLLEQTRQDPEFLGGLAKTMKEKPGMVSTIASNFANDPQTGLKMIGMYSGFQQGIGQIMEQFMGADFTNAIAGVMMKLMSMFGNVPQLLSMSNNGGELTRALMGQTGSKADVAAVDPESGDARNTPNDRFMAGGPDGDQDAAVRGDGRRPVIAAVGPDMGMAGGGS